MNRLNTFMVLIGTAWHTAHAQGLGACPGQEIPGVMHGVSAADRDRRLQDFGYAGNENSLRSALEDRRGEIRAMAALKLAAIGKKEDLPVLLRAWSGEKDDCAHATMELAISIFAAQIAYDPRQHPGGQPRIAPFQACEPSNHPVIELTLEQAKEVDNRTAMVRVTARNVTSEAIALVRSRSPGDEFSTTVLSPDGEHARISKHQEDLYKPTRLASSIGHDPTFLPLLPEQSVSWMWAVGDEFDMSAPGTYHVSFGGLLSYLGSTVCSNTADVVVGSDQAR